MWTFLLNKLSSNVNPNYKVNDSFSFLFERLYIDAAGLSHDATTIRNVKAHTDNQGIYSFSY